MRCTWRLTTVPYQDTSNRDYPQLGVAAEFVAQVFLSVGRGQVIVDSPNSLRIALKNGRRSGQALEERPKKFRHIVSLEFQHLENIVILKDQPQKLFPYIHHVCRP
jgi:hypothetical protein